MDEIQTYNFWNKEEGVKKKFMRIIVDSQELKDRILEESKYVHDQEIENSDMCNILMHLYMNPDMIEIE